MNEIHNKIQLKRMVIIMSKQICNQWPVQQCLMPNPRMCYIPQPQMFQYTSMSYPPMGCNRFVNPPYLQWELSFESSMIALHAERQENHKLRVKLSKLNVQLKKESKLNLERSSDSKTIVQIEKVLPDELKNLLAELTDKNDEITKLKLQTSKLEAELSQLKCELKEREANINSLNVLTEILMVGNEKRDETIVRCKNKLQKYINIISSTGGDSLLGNVSSVLISDNESSIPSSLIDTSLPSNASQQRQIGSKALPALTALGAENTAGPWFCLMCSKHGFPLNISSYPEFRQHLTDVHKETIDAALCEKCGWRSRNDRELDLHKFEAHQIQSLFYSFAKSAILRT